jgi:hypothetical protein
VNIKDPIAQTNADIRKLEEKLPRIDEQMRKLSQQSEAAHRSATEMRAKAGEVAALVAVGDDDGRDTDALALERQAEHEEVAAARYASTLNALSNLRATTERDLRTARAERKRLGMVGFEEHAAGVVSQRDAALLEFVGFERRVRALEMIRRSLGDSRPLLRSKDTEIAASVAYAGRLVGHPAVMAYSAMHECYRPHEGAQGEAIEAELELLAKQGVEV